MNKRVFIIHGWEGCPQEGWYPWLKKELEKRGFEVSVPQMPDTDKPRIYNWVPAITKTVVSVDENTYFIGHSIGCQAIARFIESSSENAKVGGAVFIAGFFKRLTGLEEDPEVQETYKHWLTTPINFGKVRIKIKKSIAIFSEDDPWVPLDNQDDFKNKLGSKIIIVKGYKHFSEDDGVKELPVALDAILEISKN